MLESLTTAREDVAWFFTSGDAAMGFHAAGIESSGSRVFDDDASHRAHMARRKHEHRRDVDRRGRIHRQLAELHDEQRKTLALAFTPFGAEAAPRRVQLAFATKGLATLAIVLSLDATFRAFKVAHSTTCEPTFPMLLGWFRSEVDPKGDKRWSVGRDELPQKLRPLRDEAVRIVTDALEAFDAVRMRDVLRRRDEREAVFQAEKARLHAKLWGVS